MNPLLRLVPPPGQATDPPARRKHERSPALSMTPDERRHFRIGLDNLRRVYGSWVKLAAAMGVKIAALDKARSRRGSTSFAIAYRAAEAGNVSLEGMLRGLLSSADRCKACGAKLAAARALPGPSEPSEPL